MEEAFEWLFGFSRYLLPGVAFLLASVGAGLLLPLWPATAAAASSRRNFSGSAVSEAGVSNDGWSVIVTSEGVEEWRA